MNTLDLTGQNFSLNPQYICNSVSPRGWQCDKTNKHTVCVRYGYGDTVIEAWKNNKTLTEQEYFSLPENEQ